MRNYKNTGSDTIERVKQAVNPPPKPKQKVKTFRTGSEKLDAVNNPSKSLNKMFRDVTKGKK